MGLSPKVGLSGGEGLSPEVGLGSGATHPVPQANFSGTPTSGTAPLEVTFTDSSTGSPTNWFWQFGDGETSTEQSPVHEYAEPGTYTVSLSVSTADGGTTKTEVDYVVAEEAPAYTGPLDLGTDPLYLGSDRLTLGVA